MPDRVFGFDTLCLHAGQIPDAQTGARALPIYQTTSFVFDSADHAASLFNLQTFGNVYSRISNPTVAALEERVAALEGGRAALATATGMAAQMVALLTLAQAGDHIVSARTLYGGTYTQFAVTFAQFGIETTFVDADDPRGLPRRRSSRNTKAIYAETIGNPQLNVCDLAALSAIAHEAGVPLVVDNTLASPYLCRPFEHGADIVVHSLTKYLGGHGTTMGGIVVESGKFPWDNGNFPQMTEPSRGYHGVRFYETFGDFGFTMRARMETMRTLGPTLSPLSAFLLLQGIETLHLRMPRHCASALAVAQHLASHPQVEWVQYPLLRGNREREPRREVPAARRRRHPHVRREGRRARRREVHRVGAVPLAPRERRRREDAGHPPGVHDAPPALRGRAGRRRRAAGDDPAVDRARVARRHPLGHRPGTGEVAAMIRYRDDANGRGPASWSRSRCSRRSCCCAGSRHAAARPPSVWRVAVMTLGVASLALLAAAAAAPRLRAGRARLRGADGVRALRAVRARARALPAVRVPAHRGDRLRRRVRGRGDPRSRARGRDRLRGARDSPARRRRGSRAMRHVWLQSLPPGEVPACGPGLNYMLETLPFTDVLVEGVPGQRRMRGHRLALPRPFDAGVDARVLHHDDGRGARADRSGLTQEPVRA